MLLPLVATALLGAAATPTPRAAQGAHTVVHAPSLDRLGGVAAFLTRAGALAPLLRPEAWTGDFHPFLPVDPFDAKSLRAAGIDPAGAATTSLLQEGRIACTRLADAAAYQRSAEAQLRVPLERKRTGALTTFTLAGAGPVRVGYVQQGKEACAFASPEDARALLKEATRLVRRAPTADARLARLPGALFLLRNGPRGGVVGLEGDAQGLVLEGASASLPLPAFAAAGTSPYRSMLAAAGPALLEARAAVSRTALPAVVDGLRAQVERACPECPRGALGAVAEAVGPQLTGWMQVRVAEVRSRGSLRTPAARLFAPRQALAAQVKSAAAVRAALAPLARLPGASALPDGHALAVPGGTLLLRLVGNQLVVGNDAAVVDGLVRELDPTTPVTPVAPQAVSGALFQLDPQRVAAGLAQVSLLDVVGSPELAGLFAVGAELGPLLRRSEPALGWVRGGAGGKPHRFGLTWRLTPSPQ